MKSLAFLVVVLAACGTTSKPAPHAATTPPAAAARPVVAPTKTACDAGDQSIESSTACLQDDAACYQLVDGTWCTGARPHQGGAW